MKFLGGPQSKAMKPHSQDQALLHPGAILESQTQDDKKQTNHFSHFFFLSSLLTASSFIKCYHSLTIMESWSYHFIILQLIHWDSGWLIHFISLSALLSNPDSLIYLSFIFSLFSLDCLFSLILPVSHLPDFLVSFQIPVLPGSLS